MKIKVFSPDPEEKTLTLALRQGGDGVILVAIDPETGLEKGQGLLLSITGEGRLILHSNISRDFGLDLDEAGRLVVHHP